MRYNDEQKYTTNIFRATNDFNKLSLSLLMSEINILSIFKEEFIKTKIILLPLIFGTVSKFLDTNKSTLTLCRRVFPSLNRLNAIRNSQLLTERMDSYFYSMKLYAFHEKIKRKILLKIFWYNIENMNKKCVSTKVYMITVSSYKVMECNILKSAIYNAVRL